MTNSLLKQTFRNSIFVLGLVLTASGAVVAQDETVSVDPATVVVTTTAGEAAGSYTVTDFSFYMSEYAAVEDVAAYTDITLSISGAVALDAKLLEWAGQPADGADALRNLNITVSVADADGTEHDMVYEVSDARVTSLSTSHSSYAASANLSLQIAAGSVTIDGIKIK